MKVKYNKQENTVSLKGLTYDQLVVINTLLYNTRLGNDKYALAAFEVLNALEKKGFSDAICGLVIEGEEGIPIISLV